MNESIGTTRVFMIVAAGVLLATGSANAVTRERSVMQNATGVCQAALPAFEGQIRKRPLAVQNEGTASAFVSCSLAGSDNFAEGARGINEAYVGLINNTSSPISVTCTLVDGFAKGANVFVTKTLSVGAMTSTQIGWSPSDNAGSEYNYTVNVSCNLPVGTGLSYTFVYYDEDVGA